MDLQEFIEQYRDGRKYAGFGQRDAVPRKTVLRSYPVEHIPIQTVVCIRCGEANDIPRFAYVQCCGLEYHYDCHVHPQIAILSLNAEKQQLTLF